MASLKYVWGGASLQMVAALCTISIDSFSQQITNIDTKFDGNNIVVTYDIEEFRGRDRYLVKLTFKDQDGNIISPQTVEGDHGYRQGGKSNEIIWAITKDYYYFTGTIKPILEIADKYKLLGGPGNAFLSIMMPGLGDHRVFEKRKRLLNFQTYAVATMIGYGIFQKLHFDDLYDKYFDAVDQVSIDDYYRRANIANYQYYIAIGAGLILWSADVIAVAIKGTKNTRKKKDQSVGGLNFDLGLGSNHVSEGMIVTYKF